MKNQNLKPTKKQASCVHTALDGVKTSAEFVDLSIILLQKHQTETPSADRLQEKKMKDSSRYLTFTSQG